MKTAAAEKLGEWIPQTALGTGYKDINRENIIHEEFVVDEYGCIWHYAHAYVGPGADEQGNLSAAYYRNHPDEFPQYFEDHPDILHVHAGSTNPNPEDISTLEEEIKALKEVLYEHSKSNEPTRDIKQSNGSVDINVDTKPKTTSKSIQK